MSNYSNGNKSKSLVYPVENISKNHSRFIESYPIAKANIHIECMQLHIIANIGNQNKIDNFIHTNCSYVEED